MLSVHNLTLNIGVFQLKDISLHVSKGEYFILLGESGSGKSLLLESIAGLTKPQSGQLFMNQNEITHTQIQKRNVGLVFQDHALFPHLTVEENITYPLRIKKINTSKIKESLAELATEMNIVPFLKRHPETLSGGEKQRVALARTLILKPDILLLDEPLSSMDVSLKADLRSMLRRINQKGQTILHVTHDYEEAISLAHRIGVIHNGQIIQTGTSHEVFTHPKNQFVAHFGGVKNFYPATLKPGPDHETTKAHLNEHTVIDIFTKHKTTKGFVLIGQKNILLSPTPHPQGMMNQFHGTIKEIVPASMGYEIVVDCGILFYVSITSDSITTFDFKEKQEVWLAFNPSSVRFIPG